MIVKDTEEVQTKKKNAKGKHISSENKTDEDDVDQLEAFLARRFHRGKGKFKGKFPIICFNCNEVGHIVTRGTQKNNNKEGSTRTGKKIVTKITKIKERDAILLKKTMMRMMMK